MPKLKRDHMVVQDFAGPGVSDPGYNERHVFSE